MPVGAGNSLPTIYAKIKGLKKGSKELFFECKVKKGDTYVDYTDQVVTNIEGTLMKVEAKNYEYEGETIDYLEFLFNDGVNRIKLSLGLNGMTTGILNSLIGCESIGNVAISIYRNAKGYPAAYVTNNGEKTEWSWDIEKLKSMVDVVKVGNKDVIDSSARDAFLLEEIKNLKIKGEEPAKVPQASANNVVAVENVAGVDVPFAETTNHDENDDLPF